MRGRCALRGGTGDIGHICRIGHTGGVRSGVGTAARAGDTATRTGGRRAHAHDERGHHPDAGSND